MIKFKLQKLISEVILQKFDHQIGAEELLIVPTKKEFTGDFTLTVFPIAGKLKLSPVKAATVIGDELKLQNEIEAFEVIQGFLNITLVPASWQEAFEAILSFDAKEYFKKNNKNVLVEYCSPNTNKPLHLGHVRNILLGAATSKILSTLGYHVNQIQVINDRGIAICKSMLAWKKWGNNSRPDTENIKGDHFVGNYYVLFETEFNKEYTQWQIISQAEIEYEKRKDLSLGHLEFFKEFKNQYFNKYSNLGKEARDMLLSWERGDKETLELWKNMNQWVFNGFETTLKKLNVNFDHTDYESITYLLGKNAVESGLRKGILYKKDDGSVWIDLTDVGMDHKVVLRSDGTSVYITQDIGTAQMRYEKFKMDKLIYVVADEQDYHFKALFEILKKFNEPYASGLYHLSYGMVELPEGKMKSREGTVVDADDLIQELEEEATKIISERGELEDITKEDQTNITESIAMGALKFFMLKVHPKKRMVFNPKESLDMQGQTGPYIQNAYVRIQSILRKSLDGLELDQYKFYDDLAKEEKELIVLLEAFPSTVWRAGEHFDPSEIANYSYALAKAFHKFYHEIPILRSENKAALHFRLKLAGEVGLILKKSFELLGINMPDRM